MPDRAHRRLRLDPAVALIDKRSGRKVGELRSCEVYVDAQSLADLVEVQITLGAEDGHGPEGVEKTSRSTTTPQREDSVARESVDERIATLWAHWLTLRKPRRSTMGKGSERQLRRAISVGYSDADIKGAMAALMASDWHAERNLQTLSSIFATRPGGPTFEDQVDTWIERGKQGTKLEEGSAAGGVVNSAKDTVRRTWALRLDSSVAKEHFEDAMRILAQHGISVHDNNGRPEFS